MHTDGYKGYRILPNVTIVGCFAHVRRKFDEALKGMPSEARGDSVAARGLVLCNQLFELEREFANLLPDQRYDNRLALSLPIAHKLLELAQSFENQAKSLTKTAADYFVNQWPYLKNIFLDGRLELSNNRAERSIKPFVIGRKNWLFSSSQKGARASSIVYSIIETAKENNLKPFEYLKFIFHTLPNSSDDDLDAVLPWAASIPDFCRCQIPR